MVIKRLAKHVHKLLKNISSLSLNQARISEWDPDDMSRLVVEICPLDGYYEGAKFNFVMILDEDFPEIPPRVFCETPIYHPNIDTTDEDEYGYTVCLSMFDDDEWSNKMGLEECVIGLLYLLYNPNMEDPLSPWFSSDFQTDNFQENLKKSLDGETIEGFDFKENKDCVCKSAVDDPVAVDMMHILNGINTHEDEGSGDIEDSASENEDAGSDSDEREVVTATELNNKQDLTVILINMDRESTFLVKNILDVFDMKVFSSHISDCEIMSKHVTGFCVDSLSNCITPGTQPSSLLKLPSAIQGEFTIMKDCWDERSSYLCAISSGYQNDRGLYKNIETDSVDESSETKTRSSVSVSVTSAQSCPITWQQIHCNLCTDKITSPDSKHVQQDFHSHPFRVNMDWLDLLLNSVYDSSSSSNHGNYFW